MANATVTPVTQPTVLLNGVARPDKITGEQTATVTNNPVISLAGPVTLGFTAGTGATVRYTLNGKNPTLGSPALASGSTVTLRSNANGFGSDNTIIKAKAYLNGEVSEITKVELVIT